MKESRACTEAQRDKLRVAEQATAADIVELARVALGDLEDWEVTGGDGHGTDGAPVLIAARGELVAILERGQSEARAAAAYALGFVVDGGEYNGALLAKA